MPGRERLHAPLDGMVAHPQGQDSHGIFGFPPLAPTSCFPHTAQMDLDCSPLSKNSLLLLNHANKPQI